MLMLMVLVELVVRAIIVPIIASSVTTTSAARSVVIIIVAITHVLLVLLELIRLRLILRPSSSSSFHAAAVAKVPIARVLVHGDSAVTAVLRELKLGCGGSHVEEWRLGGCHSGRHVAQAGKETAAGEGGGRGGRG